MAKVEPIIVTDNDTGKSYTLEFSRDSVTRAENEGFTLENLGKYPSKLYDLWFYSFQMHHSRAFMTRELTRKKTDEMLDAIGGAMDAPEGLWERLGELYVAAYKTLEGDEKNGRVTVKL